jgi:16S rRNA processing protein RimM
MSPHAERPRFVVTGRVIKPYGVQGWVKIEVLSVNPRRFQVGNAFVLEGYEDKERIVLEETREDAGALLARFRGSENREQAAELSGKRLLVPPDEVGEAPPGSFWEHQLIGMTVNTRAGACLGEVIEVMETGANDVLVVKGDTECLIPMIEEVVTEIDVGAGTIIIDPLPGLLEE